MNNKIDRRKKYILMLDCETANGFYDPVSKTIDLQDSIVYDLGFAIIDKKGRVYEEYSCVITDVFFEFIDMMNSAYYNEKIPQYLSDLRNGTRIARNFLMVRDKIHFLLKKYNCTVMCAHNARFDTRALNNTIRYLTKSKLRYFFPYGTEVWDTMEMAKSVILPMPTYQRFCIENGYMTKHKNPRPRLTAEIIYRFISGNNEFEESHTGLEDVDIERQILAYCFRKHKKMKKVLYAGKTKKEENY